MPAPDVPPEDVLPDVPPADEPLVPLSPPQSLAAHCGSLGLRLAHLDDLLFWPERVAAGVFVAFSCDAPLALMWLCALSRPVDLLVEDLEPFDVDDFDVEPEVPTSPLLLFIVEDVPELGVDGELIEPVLDEPLVPSDPEVEPLLPDEEPVPLSEEPSPDVDEVPLPYVLPEVLEPFALLEPVLPALPVLLFMPLLCVVVALVLLLSFLCLRSPIARAEPLASAMMEVSTNAGASLRILPPIGLWFRGITCGSLAASRVPSLDAGIRG